jgi:hypothetical protein
MEDLNDLAIFAKIVELRSFRRKMVAGFSQALAWR